MAQLGLNQSHAWHGALGQHLALGIDHHPGTVQVQAGVGQSGVLHRNASTRLDGIDPQLIDQRMALRAVWGC
jgi:hypothetical protein